MEAVLFGKGRDIVAVDLGQADVNEGVLETGDGTELGNIPDECERHQDNRNASGDLPCTSMCDRDEKDVQILHGENNVCTDKDRLRKGDEYENEAS